MFIRKDLVHEWTRDWVLMLAHVDFALFDFYLLIWLFYHWVNMQSRSNEMNTQKIVILVLALYTERYFVQLT